MARHVACGNVSPRAEWPDCCWPGCQRATEGGGLPLCPPHVQHVGMAWMLEGGVAQAILPRAAKAEPASLTLEERLADRAERMAAQSQVYYIRIGDHVKIGYTINLRQRLGALRVDDDALLATEPGGREMEARRHRQFAEERVGRRENFNPSRRLLEHIEAVRAEHGPPKITTYKSALEARPV